MRAFAAVLAREVFERRFAFVVAFVAGFVPLIGSLAYGWRSPDAAEGRVLVAFVGATALSAAFAILLGGAVIVGETREKRISFYFSRPIPSGAIWAAKLSAAVFITLSTALLAFAPGWLSGTGHARSLWGFDATPGNTVLAALVLSVVLVLGSHAVVTVGRLRSPWVALDLLLAPALVLVAGASVFSLARDRALGAYQNGGPANLPPLLEGLVAVLLAALAAASYVQVAAGRTDARRAHGAFSVVLWGILGTAAAGLGGFAWWAASARATDLVSVEVGALAAPRGSWTVVGGRIGSGRGYGSFLFDAAGARSIRTRSGNVNFSADGARAAWGEVGFGFLERGTKAGVFVADLGTAKAVDTGIECGRWSNVVLSPSGRRLAILDRDTLAVYDVARPDNPQQLAAFRLEREVRQVAFVDEDVIRLFPRFTNALRKDVAPAALEITEFSLPSKRSLVTGRFDRETVPFLRLSADGNALVGAKDKRLTLHDGRTGALVATLAEDLRSPQLRFLTRGRIAVAGIAGAQARLILFEGEKGWGAPGRLVELGPARRVVLGGEIAPGHVALSLLPVEEDLPASWRATKLAIVDMATGAVSAGPDGLVPADRFSWWFSPVLSPGEAGSPSASLFLDAGGRLVRLDPATGAQTVLLGRSK